MKKSRFSESQIVEFLQEGESGAPVAKGARKHGISPARSGGYWAKLAVGKQSQPVALFRLFTSLRGEVW